MTLSKLPNEQDPIAIRQAIQRLNKRLGQQAIPTFAGISVTGGLAIASTLTAGAISAGAGSFTSVNASGGVAIVSAPHVAAISATGTISGGAGIFSSISSPDGSFVHLAVTSNAVINRMLVGGITS